MLKRLRGFTLMEMLAVLAVIALLGQGYMRWKSGVIEDQIVQRTVDGFALVDEAAYAFRLDSGAPPAWPGSMAVLAPYLGSGTPANGVGTGYTLTATPTSLQMQTTMLTAGQARAVARAFPANATFDATTFAVTLEIPIPGHETSHNALLPRDGTRAMLADLDFGGFSAINVDRVEATGTLRGSRGVLTDDVTLGGTCNANEIGLTSTGALATCQPRGSSHIWVGAACSVVRIAASRHPNRCGNFGAASHELEIEDSCGTTFSACFVGSNA